MKIGIDIDGVLANYNQSYVDLIVGVSGENRFPEEWKETGPLPPTWYYSEHFGYSKEVIGQVWKRITESKDFWYSLQPLPNIELLRKIDEGKDEFYFVTDRTGIAVKAQTEMWLSDYLSVWNPTVLITGNKGGVCKALKLDAYIDDKLGNINDVQWESPLTRDYLLDAPSNREKRESDLLRPPHCVVRSLNEFLTAEKLV